MASGFRGTFGIAVPLAVLPAKFSGIVVLLAFCLRLTPPSFDVLVASPGVWWARL